MNKRIFKELVFQINKTYNSPLFWIRIAAVTLAVIAVELFMVIDFMSKTFDVYVDGGHVKVSGTVDVDNIEW